MGDRMDHKPAGSWWRAIQDNTPVRIGKNSISLLSGQLGTYILALVLAGQLMRTVGAEGLGRYLVALTIELIVLMIADLGLGIYTTRELARDQPAAEAASLWATVLTLRLVAVVIAVIALNGIVAPVFFPGPWQRLIAIVSLAIAPDSFNSAVGALVKAYRRMEVFSLITLAARALGTGAGVLLLIAGKDESAVLLAYAAASGAGSLAYAVLLRRWRVGARWSAVGVRWRPVLRQSVPFALTGICAMLQRRVGLLLLASWQGDAAAGLFGAAHRLWEAMGILPACLLDALFPEMSRLGTGEAGRLALRRFRRQGRRLMLALSALLVLPGLLVAPALVDLIFGASATAGSAQNLFRLLLLCLPFTALCMLNGHVLYVLGRQRQVTVAMAATTLTGIALYVVFIPAWSAWGTAAVLGFTEILLWALLALLAARALPRREVSASGPRP